MKKCNTCGEINKDNAEFCLKCGEQFSNSNPLCPNCGSVIAKGNIFCNKCGKELIETGSKKETHKYIEGPVVEKSRNLSFKIFIGLVSGFAAIVIIVLILVYAIGINNLTNPFKPITEAGKGEQITELPKEELTEDQLQVLSILGYPDEYVIIFDEGNNNIRIEMWTFEAMQSSFLFEGGKYISSEVVITPVLLPDDYNIRPEEFVYSMTSEEVGCLIGEDGHQITETSTGLKTIIYGEGNIVCTYNTDNLLVYVSRSKEAEIAKG